MLAYFTMTERGASDLLVADLVRVLHARGLSVAGTVQLNSEHQANRRAKMQVRVLGTDQIITISQDLGALAKGCKLDPSALEDAALAVDATLNGGCDVLVLAKFGKQERDGQGFRDVIVRALDLDVPVVLGVNPTLEQAFLDFADVFAVRIEPDTQKIADWIETQKSDAN